MDIIIFVESILHSLLLFLILRKKSELVIMD